VPTVFPEQLTQSFSELAESLPGFPQLSVLNSKAGDLLLEQANVGAVGFANPKTAIRTDESLRSGPLCFHEISHLHSGRGSAERV